MKNKKIAEVFYEIADILDIKGDTFFKINAYRKGAQIVENYPRELKDVYTENQGEIPKISGIGEGLHKKIIEMIESLKCSELEKLKKGFPEGLLDILSLRGVGPKKVRLFYEKLGIDSVEMLKDAAEKGQLAELERMGEKSQQEILDAIKEKKSFDGKRFLIDHALTEAQDYIKYMKELSEIDKISYAGSLRRMQETIGDIDILVTLKGAKSNVDGDFNKVSENIGEHFIKYKKVYNVLSHGDTKSSVILISGIQVDLRVLDNDSFGAAMHYFTGSKEHNIRIREIAKSKGLKVSEYGVFDGENKIASKSEKDVFNILDLSYIPPELRKDDGEVDYVLKNNSIPNIIEYDELKGDMHVHSKESGLNILEIADRYMDFGLDYITIANHSHRLDEGEFLNTFKEIESVNKKLDGKFFIFKGVEGNIQNDGSLDVEKSVIEKSDFIIASCHGPQDLSRKEQTTAIIKAISQEKVLFLGHPTNRSINKRDPYDIDLETIFAYLKEKGVYVEINSKANRLDLNEKNTRLAKSFGLKFFINSDFHKNREFERLKFGVGQARRAWLSKEDVLNTLSLNDIKKIVFK